MPDSHEVVFYPRTAATGAAGAPTRLARVGDAMRRYRGFMIAIQWCVVVFYLALLIIPAFMPIPPDEAHIYNNLRLFAQFLFWGVWWPFVMLSMMLMGRVWCGVFCPEGTLTEFASRYGLGRAIPRWLRWSGWPFVAFVGTTVYGQLVSVYEYPQAALLVLGGSSVAALVVGWVYGKEKRVWCRYLCPANGVFGLLAKIAPLHFRVDEEQWQRNVGTPASMAQPKVNCAPLINIKQMKSASSCHACGRCSGQNGAVELALRAPTAEILSSRNQDIKTEHALTLTFGVLGIATAAFLWSASSRFVAMKTAAAEWLIERNAFALLQDNAPWWVLTHYPAANDVFTWLDGLLILGWIVLGGLLLGAASWLPVYLAARVARRGDLSWQRLSMGLVPLAGMSIFLGLSMLTLGHLKAEHVNFAWVPAVRMGLLLVGSSFTAWLGWGLLRVPHQLSWRSVLAWGLFVLPVVLLDWVWAATFFAL